MEGEGERRKAVRTCTVSLYTRRVWSAQLQQCTELRKINRHVQNVQTYTMMHKHEQKCSDINNSAQAYSTMHGEHASMYIVTCSQLSSSFPRHVSREVGERVQNVVLSEKAIKDNANLRLPQAVHKLGNTHLVLARGVGSWERWGDGQVTPHLLHVSFKLGTCRAKDHRKRCTSLNAFPHGPLGRN